MPKIYYKTNLGGWVDPQGNPAPDELIPQLEETLNGDAPINVGGNADLEAEINRLKLELKEAKETAQTNADWADTFHKQKAEADMLLGMVEQAIDGKLAFDGDPPELISKLITKLKPEKEKKGKE
jgi:hypothetical protein